MQHLMQLMLCAMIMQGDLAAAEAPDDDDDDEQGRQTADDQLQEAAADQSDTVSSEKPSPHQGLSHEQYRSKRGKKRKIRHPKAIKSSNIRSSRGIKRKISLPKRIKAKFSLARHAQRVAWTVSLAISCLHT